MPEAEHFEDDPANLKIFESFKKVSMHQFWKKVKGSFKSTGEPEERKAFDKLYKSFNMGLGKILDKFDNCFPDPGEMKKYSGQLDKIFSDYEKKVDNADVDTRTRMVLSGCIDKLNTEVKRRLAWAKKYVK